MTELYLRTSLRPEKKAAVTKKSLALAFCSLLFVVASEYLFAWLELSVLCLFSRILGTGAIGFSALLQKRLFAKEKNPDILYSDERALSFFKANKSLFSLSWQDIASFHFVDTGKDYGLAFTLKSPIPELSEKCRKEHGVDLFLPDFSEASFFLLEKWRNEHVVIPN